MLATLRWWGVTTECQGKYIHYTGSPNKSFWQEPCCYRTVGMAMWGLFQVINVVVLLNVCVALMNNTMIIINEEQF